ncbi:MAG: putative quinol monooxygenase [Candidatus Velthaea sp.]
MLHVLAFITAKPGQRAALLAAFNENVPNVRAEPGCIGYAAATDAPGFGAFQALVGDDAFVVVEQWVSPEALNAHIAAPHMKAYAAKTKELVASRAINVLMPV